MKITLNNRNPIKLRKINTNINKNYLMEDNNPLFESNILSDSSSEENLSETSLASQALNSTVKSSPTVRSEPSTVI